MRRGISSKAALVASLAIGAHGRAVEVAGGFYAPPAPNRELRRRMEREARKELKRTTRAPMEQPHD